MRGVCYTSRMQAWPGHVALLVRSVDQTAASLTGLPVGPAELWDGEGTKEIYVGLPRPCSLLLMEAVKPGAYRRALDKRGPGLHHLAIDVQDLAEAERELIGEGWKVRHRLPQTLFFSHAKFPGLLEVQRKRGDPGPPFIEFVGLPTEVTVPGFEEILRPWPRLELRTAGRALELLL